MNFLENLNKFNLNPDNSIVIGSGIMNALNLRESHDIDLVVPDEIYSTLSQDRHFKVVNNHGHDVLVNNVFEIGTSWTVIGRTWRFTDFLSNSIIIDGVRYITPEFLLKVKSDWLSQGDDTPKTNYDIELLEDYLEKNKKPRMILG